MRRRIVRAGVLAAALASSLVFAMPSGAVTGGTAVAPTTSWGPWAAYIVVNHNGARTVCSGALVAPRWILTAAQCVARTTLDACTYAPPYAAPDFTVYVGRTNATVTGTAYRVSSVNVHNNSATSADGQCVLQNDIALIQLATAAKAASTMWIAPSQAAVTNGTNTVLYGYGLTNPSNAKSYGSLEQTNAGDWTIDTQCDLASLIGATCLDQMGVSAGSTGDTGGPWTLNVDGKPIEALVFSGYDVAQGLGYGSGVAQPSTAAWLRSKLGIPTLSPGNIVRDRVHGKSWLIDSQGYRRPIVDSATYSCLKGKGARVVNRPAQHIRRMAARAVPATCGTAASVLIAGEGDDGWTAPNDSLAALLTSAGYEVTESATLPANLTTFGQVWWVDTNPPTSLEQDQLVAFEKAGGGLFLTGERPCCEPLNSSDTEIINSVVTDGGVTAGGQGDLCTCDVPDAVNLSVVGNLSQRPFVVGQWTPSQPGGMLGVPASSVFSYYQPGDISTRQVVAAAWDRSSLVGSGRLVVFMDINWAESAFRSGNWSSVAQNVALFLSGLSTPPGPVVAPGSSLFASSPFLGFAGMLSSSTAP